MADHDARRIAADRPSAPVSHVSYYEADAFTAGPAAICRPKWNGKSSPAPASSTTPSVSSGSGPAAPTPYPGYRAIEGALGEYNGKFMVNQLVLRGSSLATPAGHSRITYRNFFYPHHRWQFTGLRLADYA